jgi:hypothetical protein
MIHLTDKLGVMYIGNHISWNTEFPTHLTYNMGDDGIFTEPFYTPGFDEKNSIRANYKIIGTIDSSGKFNFDCENYIEKTQINLTTLYKDYNVELAEEFDLITTQESFISLLNSKGISLEKLDNQKLLILEKL